MAADLHVVMLPWLAFGHIIPFFQLSIALAKHGIHISFVSTTRNIQRLPKFPSNLSNLISLVSLQLPQLDAGVLPEGGEATVDISFDQIQYLKIAYDLLRAPFENLVKEQSPDWIFVDVIPYWVTEIANKYEIPLLLFSAFSSATLVLFGHPEAMVGEGQKRYKPSPESLTKPPEWVDFPSAVAYRKFEAIGAFPGYFEQNASGISDIQRFSIILGACQAIAIRSCREFEGEYLNLYQKILGKPVIPVGSLPPVKASEGREIEDGSLSIFNWLNEQRPKSVLFVGFGSECKLNRDQIFEIAHGVELSNLPFLWALRKPSWAIEEDDIFPSGFVQKTCKRGKVLMKWAPQMEILAHPAIGGSLFHSGWGSMIETLQFGHCLVLLPFIIDQGLNARLLVEKNLAVEVERGEDGSFTKEDIAKSIRLAMVDEKGEMIRVRAREAAAIFGDLELHNQYVGELVEYLKNGALNIK